MPDMRLDAAMCAAQIISINNAITDVDDVDDDDQDDDGDIDE